MVRKSFRLLVVVAAAALFLAGSLSAQQNAGQSPPPREPGFGVGSYSPGNGVTNPVLIRQVEPTYTTEARLAKLQGEVELEAVVNANGTVGDVRIVKSLDDKFGLDQEALKAAKAWLFQPGALNGKPVPVLVTFIMTFRLPPAPAVQPTAAGFGAGSYAPGQGITNPVLIRQVEPRYTRQAREQNIEGEVELEVVVTAEGAIAEVRVAKSLDAKYGLDDQAVSAVRSWRFNPGTRNGQPVPVRVTIVLSFKLLSPDPNDPASRVTSAPTDSTAMTTAPVPPVSSQSSGARPYAIGTPGLINPRVKHQELPTYTRAAMQEKLQGDVILAVVVRADGTVGAVVIQRSFDAKFGLDQEAIKAAQQWTFEPAMLGGKPVAASVTLVISFKLH